MDRSQSWIPLALVVALVLLAVNLVQHSGHGEPPHAGRAGGAHGTGTPAAGRPDPSPPTARHDLVDGLRADRDTPRHASDGAGRAWVTQGGAAQAGGFGRWTIEFEAGPLGVSEGGVITFQTSPFWRWSPAWVDADGSASPELRARKPGLTTVSCDAPGVGLDVFSSGDGRVVVNITGRGLLSGERVTFVYGAGEGLARADDFAEHGSPFIVGVDGDGDGVRGLLEQMPRVDVTANAPAQVVATVTSVVPPGEPARLTLAVLDQAGNAGTDFTGALLLSGLPEGSDLPARVVFTAADAGLKQLSFRCPEQGVFRLIAEEEGVEEGLFALSNPIIVNPNAPGVLWGDLHGHSHLSDGTGTPEDWFRYARDVAALDVAALTDHDHWGFRFLDDSPELWERIASTVEAFHEPGRFVTLLGYEWTSWIHGHRHVLSFAERPTLEVLSSLDERYETPRQLWDALRGREVLTFAHHSAGGPIATNWSYPPDPELEPVTEVVSVHGSSEGPDGAGLIYRPVAGHFVRDALSMGYRLGFVGSGDGHDGHPGLAHLANPTGSGGLVALVTDDKSRAGVLSALRERRCYATSGARMILRASLGGSSMGSVLPAPDGDLELVLLVRGTAPLAAVDVIRSGEVIDRQEVGGESFDLLSSWTLSELGPGEVVYLRVLQVDGHLGFTSPIFVE